MAPLRLRHPTGVSTIQVDLDNSTVQDLQQIILSTTSILPSQQDLKAGYPPRPLTLIPELPLDSLGLKPGDQLIVNQKAGVGGSAETQQAASAPPGRSAVTAPTPGRTQAIPARPSAGSIAPDFVETQAGALVHRVVPDDNSCLFSSVALVFEQDMSKASKMRQIVADGIRQDPEAFNDAILGRSQSNYISTILKPNIWGGAIELSVLARHFRTEIASVDVETGRIDHFTPPPGSDSGNRCVLVYSGIHYDAASLAPTPDAPDAFHQTVFPVTSSSDSDPILVAAKKLADILRSKKAFTNTATFDLKCEICKKGLKGEKEARAHAAETGHTSFGEY